MGQRPSYVDNLKNREDRAAVCKLRISAHLLMIERGRHLNIPRNERYCNICNLNEIENEKHFFEKCKAFDDQRITLMEKISNVTNTKIQSCSISFLLKHNSYKVLKLTSSFILNCFDIRKRLI